MAELPAGPENSVWESGPDYPAPLGSDKFLSGSNNSEGSKHRSSDDKSGLRGASCSFKALNGLWGGAKFGLLAGAVGTALEVAEWGLRGPAAAGTVLRGAASGAFAFGSGIGLYRGTVCGFEQFRGVQDIYNSMLAGGVVGALSELPLMLRSYLLRDIEKVLVEQGRVILRPRPRFLVNIALGAAGCGMLHLLESSSRSTRAAGQTQADTPHAPPKSQMQVANKDFVSYDNWGGQTQDGISLEGDGTVNIAYFVEEPYWDSSEVATSVD